MKAAVITRHFISNYGSLLQSIATEKVLNKLGYEAEIIDYIRDDENYHNIEKTILKNKKPEWFKDPIKRACYLALRSPEAAIAGIKFEKQRVRYLTLTQRYTNIEQLKNDPPVADVYITGSDQVWGPAGDGAYDGAYCLSFAPREKKKISYAASFGHTEVTGELTDYFKRNLSEYDHISVRENSAVRLINDMGMKALQVLDPTLLLSADEWESYTEPIKEKKYILVYQLHNNEKCSEYAIRAAKAVKLPLVRVSASLHQFCRGGKFKALPSIGRFLSYIKNAECMITDSFHGTAFAINFNTPFVEVLPNNNTGTRNISILEMTGLSDRILNNYDNLQLAVKPIDFSAASSIIEKKRKESMDLLKYMLGK